MLKGLIFDLDGVITDTAEYHFQAWKELGRDLDITIDRHFNEKLKGVSRKESLELILNYGKQEKRYSEKEKEDLANKKNEHYKNLISDITPKDLLPGIYELLEQANESNIKMAIASASQNAPVILDKLEITNYFEVVVDPKTLQKGKPNPEIFERATEMLNLELNEVVGIEDAYSGIQSINRAGIYSIGVGDVKILSIADLVVSTTEELNLKFIESNYRARASE